MVAPFPATCPPRSNQTLLLSALAEHTRNLLEDRRASLCVQGKGEDPQASGRVTVLGTVEPTTDPSARDRYLAWHPQAESYFDMADFGLYVLKPTTARFVGGFGEMGWVDLDR